MKIYEQSEIRHMDTSLKTCKYLTFTKVGSSGMNTGEVREWTAQHPPEWMAGTLSVALALEELDEVGISPQVLTYSVGQL